MMCCHHYNPYTKLRLNKGRLMEAIATKTGNHICGSGITKISKFIGKLYFEAR